MKLDYGMKIVQDQKLVLTQSMQQSIKLLQMSMHDLREFIDNEYAENPILEINETDNNSLKDKYDYKSLIKEFGSSNYKNEVDNSYIDNKEKDSTPWNYIEKSKSLNEFLQEQLIELNRDPYLVGISKYIIESLDNRGYLEISTTQIGNELNINKEKVEQALKIVQDLEPYGIGARNIEECLIIQSKKLGILDEKMEKIIKNHLGNIADNKYKLVGEDVGIEPKEAQRYGDLIKKLEPKPSRGFYTGEQVGYIIPDAEIKKIANEYFIIMNDKVLPKLSISKTYKNVLEKNTDEETVCYVKDKINKAMFLIKSIDQRKSTLYNVLKCLLKKQKEFFEKGYEFIKPLTLKEVAEEIEMHESTVSRAIKDKYVLTSYGTIKIKTLFENGISLNTEGDIGTNRIKNEIKRIIDEENKLKPFSDKVISEILNKKNINISRRTIAKYREELGIKSSSKRKRI
ncbi:RNA polymerase factor sigma-54 [Clostridium taeniosporum]|uniref:RNA polymerase factor sigma-54 n=1 Tax=Clostridium taeniosporum TaxID=394958 RepID=A0A1D7XM50_9CLOT|nr:RNA polymerase factor sigma-54 [Clostridium taeniosporum]AOR24421.1 RNA polymerase factor sigma-54 [Clostridium taeniosporum]